MRNSKASELGKLGFYTDVKKALVYFIQKMNKRSPLLYSLTKNLKCLSPKYILEFPDTSVNLFKKVVKSMMVANLCSLDECDTAVSQFSDLLLLL